MDKTKATMWLSDIVLLYPVTINAQRSETNTNGAWSVMSKWTHISNKLRSELGMTLPCILEQHIIKFSLESKGHHHVSHLMFLKRSKSSLSSVLIIMTFIDDRSCEKQHVSPSRRAPSSSQLLISCQSFHTVTRPEYFSASSINSPLSNECHAHKNKGMARCKSNDWYAFLTVRTNSYSNLFYQPC